jgi:hypothetical protein
MLSQRRKLHSRNRYELGGAGRRLNLMRRWRNLPAALLGTFGMTWRCHHCALVQQAHAAEVEAWLRPEMCTWVAGGRVVSS